MRGFPISLASPVEHGAALPRSADVVIIGGGIIGVSTALFLARKGVKVVLLEKGRVAGEQSSRNWGWIRQQGRDLAELPIMREANQHWLSLAPETGEDIGLRQCGLTYLASDEAQLAGYEDWLSRARASGVDSRILSSSEVDGVLPGMSQTCQGALHTASDMVAEPFVATSALARLAVRDGAVIIENCAARLIDTEAGRVAGVITEQGRIRATEVVVAGGSWSTLLLRRHGIVLPQLSVRASVAATVALPLVHGGGAVGENLAFRRGQDGGYSLATAGHHEVWIGFDAFRFAPKFLPHLRNDPFERRYLPFAPKHYPDSWGVARRWSGDQVSPFEKMRILDPTPNLARLKKTAARFQALFPALGEVKLASAWAGLIDTTPDVVPVVDRVDALPGLTICTGMCGHGFGIGPGFGRIMADMVTGGEIGHDLSRFRLGRFSDGSVLELGPDVWARTSEPGRSSLWPAWDFE